MRLMPAMDRSRFGPYLRSSTRFLPTSPSAGSLTLQLEDLRDVGLELGVRHDHGVVVGRVGVAQTGQHVCDRVGHRHGFSGFLAAVSVGASTADLSAYRV